MRETMRSSCGGAKYGADWALACVASAHITNTARTMAKILPVAPCSLVQICLADITTLLGCVVTSCRSSTQRDQLLKHGCEKHTIGVASRGSLRRRHAYLNPG